MPKYNVSQLNGFAYLTNWYEIKASLFPRLLRKYSTRWISCSFFLLPLWFYKCHTKVCTTQRAIIMCRNPPAPVTLLMVASNKLQTLGPCRCRYLYLHAMQFAQFSWARFLSRLLHLGNLHINMGLGNFTESQCLLNQPVLVTKDTERWNHNSG